MSLSNIVIKLFSLRSVGIVGILVPIAGNEVVVCSQIAL